MDGTNLNELSTADLILEGRSRSGMLNEIDSKCNLLLSQVDDAEQDGPLSDDFIANIQVRLRQMWAEYDKYASELKLIYQRLKEQGVLTQVA